MEAEARANFEQSPITMLYGYGIGDDTAKVSGLTVPDSNTTVSRLEAASAG